MPMRYQKKDEEQESEKDSEKNKSEVEEQEEEEGGRKSYVAWLFGYGNNKSNKDERPDERDHTQPSTGRNVSSTRGGKRPAGYTPFEDEDDGNRSDEMNQQMNEFDDDEDDMER